MNRQNKTVVVTGASSGVGFALAEAYVERGYNVVGNARTRLDGGTAAGKW
ncbi:NAD(P)-dependent dehydrogenase (short-subunit alcohol dehydrogenase family) [Paraburkholderia sp. GAS348]